VLGSSWVRLPLLLFCFKYISFLPTPSLFLVLRSITLLCILFLRLIVLLVKKKLQQVSYILLNFKSATYLGYIPRCISSVICIQADYMFRNIFHNKTERGKKGKVRDSRGIWCAKCETIHLSCFLD